MSLNPLSRVNCILISINCPICGADVESQSPKSGQLHSNREDLCKHARAVIGLNPLSRVNCILIEWMNENVRTFKCNCKAAQVSIP